MVEGSEDDEPAGATAAVSNARLTKAVISSDSDEEDDGHLTLHQQMSPVVVLPSTGIDDSDNYLVGITTGKVLAISLNCRGT